MEFNLNLDGFKCQLYLKIMKECMHVDISKKCEKLKTG